MPGSIGSPALVRLRLRNGPPKQVRDWTAPMDSDRNRNARRGPPGPRASLALGAARLYKEDDRFVETYFSRFGKERYLVGDAARRDSDGYFWVIGRIDDVVVSGRRLSTAEVESEIVAHEKVAEAAVIGQSDEDSGQAICAFVTLRGGTEPSEELVEGIRTTVAERIGKFAWPKRIIWADDLPKTRSGKIMRRLCLSLTAPFPLT